MRSLPTRRELTFAITFLITFVLFLQFAFGPAPTDVDHDPGHAWSQKVTIPWLGGGGDHKVTVTSPENSQEGSIQAPKPGSTTPFLEAVGDARESALVWGTKRVPTTEIRLHVPGWTMYDRLYLMNGTVFIVTDEPKKIPDRMLLISSGYPIQNGAEEAAKRLPTDTDMQVISPERATELFGSYANRLDGTSFIINDPPQFINHYYHWAAEIFFGLWRAYSTLDPDITIDGSTKLPAPRRIMMSHVPYSDWRDYASMNQWVTRGAFPSISLEAQEDWADRASMASPFVLERVVFEDRASAMHSPNFLLTQRCTAELFKLTASPHWWSTIRSNLLEFSGSAPHKQNEKVITYVSRQEWGRRMLIQEHHQRLVSALEALRDKYGYEVNIVSMDQLSRQEQFQLAGRTTIMMGVHGNGLTSLLWMNPSKRATVMEFFYPGGFAHDYEWTTRALGMKHYGFWNSEYFTSPDLPPVAYPDGFQGNEIPIDGEAVARLCHERLSLPEH